MNAVLASIIIVTYNTKILLGKCLRDLKTQLDKIHSEVIIVDNDSHDGTQEMVQQDFPECHLIKSPSNLGFGGANNLGIEKSKGKYIVLLNSDAFFYKGALSKAIIHMENNPTVGLAGGKLVGTKGEWQPSARSFPTILNDFLLISGLSTRYPKSSFFGRGDRTWASVEEPAEIDWPPGAFSIIRKEVLNKVGTFDPRFFFYYEEVDLCKRIKEAGFKIMYWPDIMITHLGGESIKEMKEVADKNLTLWRLRSLLLFYRKHHGFLNTYLRKNMEVFWYQARILKNKFSEDPEKFEKIQNSKKMINLLDLAWNETEGGKISPHQPWSF